MHFDRSTPTNYCVEKELHMTSALSWTKTAESSYWDWNFFSPACASFGSRCRYGSAFGLDDQGIKETLTFLTYFSLLVVIDGWSPLLMPHAKRTTFGSATYVSDAL